MDAKYRLFKNNGQTVVDLVSLLIGAVCRFRANSSSCHDRDMPPEVGHRSAFLLQVFVGLETYWILLGRRG
jgi:hypothetical protein